jgi:uncharacterized membrane protein HdeD (DUF308 family)
MFRMAARIARNPYINLFIGLVMLTSGASEIIEEFEQMSEGFRLRAHHGVFAYGMLSFLKALADIAESADYVDKGKIKKS